MDDFRIRFLSTFPVFSVFIIVGLFQIVAIKGSRFASLHYDSNDQMLISAVGIGRNVAYLLIIGG